MNGWMNEWINGYFKPVFCCCDGIGDVTEDDTDVLVWYKSLFMTNWKRPKL